MNIYKKTMILMALCCSLGAPISAVDMSQPQDHKVAQTAAKFLRIARAFKQSIDKTVTALGEFNIKEYISENIYEIKELEKLSPEFCENANAFKNMVQPMKSNKDSLNHLGNSSEDIYCVDYLNENMSKMLDSIGTEWLKDPRIKGCLDKAKKSCSLSVFLEAMQEINAPTLPRPLDWDGMMAEAKNKICNDNVINWALGVFLGKKEEMIERLNSLNFLPSLVSLRKIEEMIEKTEKINRESEEMIEKLEKINILIQSKKFVQK